MMDFIFRDIDRRLWARFKKRADQDGRTLRQTLMMLVRYYVKHGLPVEAGPRS